MTKTLKSYFPLLAVSCLAGLLIPDSFRYFLDEKKVKLIYVDLYDPISVRVLVSIWIVGLLLFLVASRHQMLGKFAWDKRKRNMMTGLQSTIMLLCIYLSYRQTMAVLSPDEVSKTINFHVEPILISFKEIIVTIIVKSILCLTLLHALFISILYCIHKKRDQIKTS